MLSAPIICPYSMEAFLSSENLTFADEAVSSVFAMMLGVSAEPRSAQDSRIIKQYECTAIVGLSGSLRGSCEVRLSGLAARAITSAMLGGSHVNEGDDSIDDAIGELCNMIAGSWKNRISSLTSTCALSPPTVISGCNYKVHTSSSTIRITRVYRFEDHTLQLTLHRLEQKTF